MADLPSSPSPEPAGCRSPAGREATPPRLVSLDAMRGLTMVLMASAGLALPTIAARHPESGLWELVGHETSHAEWQGCTLWDLIQPSFMFLVGAALPFSLAARRARGQSWPAMFGHAAWRAVVLVVLGIFLMSNWSEGTEWTFVNVLTQIGLGYVVVFLLAGLGTRAQIAAAVAILCATWWLFWAHPLPPPDFDPTRVGVSLEKTPPFTGLFAHWNKNANVAHEWDLWFLNLFPREKEFSYNDGGYQTLNFVPSIATMLFGLAAGSLLRGKRSPGARVGCLAAAGVVCLAGGLILGWTVCPIVKRIWTPAWAIYSAGWCLLALAAFHWLVDVKGWRAWAFPLVVVGTNSIAMYCMSMLLRPWVVKTLKIHLGGEIFDGYWGPVLEQASILLVLWLFCLWLWRKRIFVRI